MKDSLPLLPKYPEQRLEKRMERVSWLQRIGTVEGWLGLALALVAWVDALEPIGPMVGMPAEAFMRDIRPLLPAVIGLGLAVAAIRLGNHGARVAGCWALALILPLIAFVTKCVMR